ncbi:MAG: NifU family protein, partial [Candidatus Limnocylindria bacterium]
MTATTMAPAATDFGGRMVRIEELLAQMAALPDPAARSGADELVRLVLELHGAGLARMLALVERQAAAGTNGADRAEQAGGAAPVAPLLTAFADDDLVRSLLLIHDLHPVALQQRVEAALESVRPMMRSHKGDVELVGIDEGVVHLRLE